MGEDLIPHIFEDCHEGLSTQEADIRLVKYGRNELPEKNTPGWLIFLMSLGPDADRTLGRHHHRVRAHQLA